jgi:hypothetical protein
VKQCRDEQRAKNRYCHERFTRNPADFRGS